MFSVAYVGLCVCLLPKFLKRLWTDYNEMSWRGGDPGGGGGGGGTSHII